MTTHQLMALLDTFHTDAQRLETLQEYSEPSEQRLFNRYRAGEITEPPIQTEWSDFLRSRKFGRRFRRIRLVREPLSAYTLFELEWLYVPNVLAGEEIRVVPVDAPYPGTDFWIFDRATLVLMDYSPDGAPLSVRVATDRADVQSALGTYDHYESQSMPLTEYLMAVRSRERG